VSQDVVIEAEHLVLEYRVPRHQVGSLKETAVRIARGGIAYDLVRAVNDVSFELRQGEVLGIIGPNGAGKSTLMKVMARVLPPTAGRVRVRGRVSPMIELGAGFNPEQTARENIILYGTLLGRDVREMKLHCGQIAEWAGLSDYLDVPIRAFSSGMVARLAFAVAVDVDPDILLVDEILSVGDEAFRRKSSERMEELIKGGAAVVLVTHSMPEIENRADRAIWLDHGKVQRIGLPEMVTSAYKAATEANPDESVGGAVR
jgi:ABC-type polysaccharide/polyol phosphate transport system ATPase subunit